MEELNLPASLKKALQSFFLKLKDIYKEDLISVVLYGSAVSGEFVDKHSNLNVLVVLRSTDLGNLKKAGGLVNKFKTINALFMTERYIAGSTDIFPIEFLDMQENYFVLFGKDVLKDIHIDLRNLRFQCEQELKIKLINLRQLYLRLNRFTLQPALFKSFVSALHVLRNVLRLKGKKPPYLKKDILKDLAVEFKINLAKWERILAAKNKQIHLSFKEAQELYIDFVEDLQDLAEIVDEL